MTALRRAAEYHTIMEVIERAKYDKTKAQTDAPAERETAQEENAEV